MAVCLNKTMWLSILFLLPVVLYSQKEVTRFLGIPVDGSKSEMIQKLKDKGFTISSYNDDLLTGEFNGSNVNIHISTNNNKVRRIAVIDAIQMSESNIKIRFNNLLRQFQNNKKYLPTPDSILQKYIIQESVNLSYEMLVHNKQYQASFFQVTETYDSINSKINALKERQNQLTSETYLEQFTELTRNLIEELYKCKNRVVWINIGTLSGKFYISIFYDNVYNEANGESL